MSLTGFNLRRRRLETMKKEEPVISTATEETKVEEVKTEEPKVETVAEKKVVHKKTTKK